MKTERRDFIKIMGMMGTGIIAGCSTDGTNKTAGSAGAGAGADYASRPSGATYMGDFAAPKIETVRCAFIGVGARGSGHASQIAEIEGTEVVAICDLYEDLAQKS